MTSGKELDQLPEGIKSFGLIEAKQGGQCGWLMMRQSVELINLEVIGHNTYFGF